MSTLSKSLVASFLVIVTIMAISVYYFSTQKNPTVMTPVVITPTATMNIPSPTAAVVSDSPTISQDMATYEDPKGVYRFSYPKEYKLDLDNNGQYVRITKIGKTQKGQTEIYDGILIVFEGISLNGKKLEAWVDDTIKTSTDVGSEITSPKKNIQVGRYSGFTYTMRGLGESTYNVIQKDPNSNFALSITYIAPDPENLGYPQEVDTILSSVELLQ